MLRINEVCSEIDAALTKNLQDAGVLCERYAKLECPVDTGVLRASIGSVAYPLEGRMMLYANTEYAAAVHEGHGKYKGVKYLQNAVLEHIPEIREVLLRR